MIEPDAAADRRHSRAPRRKSRFSDRVEDVTQPRDRQARLMKVLPDLRQTEHRRTHPASQDIEGHKLADRKIPIDDKLGTAIEYAGGDDLADELHGLARAVAET